MSIIIKNVIQRCQPQIKENQITVRCEHEENLPLLNVDGQRLEQVLANLIINATQAMKNGGQILLETGIDSTQDGPGQEKVVITITDTGPGISVDVRQRIFEPFFTTKARGTGLGLSVARRIIEEHNGTISFESKEGQGTRFMIELPLE